MTVLGEPVQRLLEEAYAASLDPARYDRLIHSWEAYLSQRSGCEEPHERESADGVLERHFARAFSILRRLSCAGPGACPGLAALPVAALVLNAQGHVIAHNARASAALFAGQPAHWDALGIDPSARAALLEWLREGAARAPARAFPCRLGVERRDSCIIARRLTPVALRELGIEQTECAHLLTTVDVQIDSEVGAAFGAAYGLTAAEAEVAVALARGGSPSAIARERGVSLNTVRTQIKLVLRKLEGSAIPDVVRMLLGFAASCPALPGAPARASPCAGSRRPSGMRSSDGRWLAYETSGALAGRPVLFIHNMLHGPGLPEPAILAAQQRNFRLIAPSRPGFGESERLVGPQGRALLDAVADDCRRLLDRLEVSQAIVLGHLSGGIYATRIAERMPERISALLLASYLPTWDDARMASMSSLPRVVALATRHTPRLLPFIVQAGCAHILAGCESGLLHMLHGPVAADVAALRRPEVRRIVIEGLRHTSVQGAAAFCGDCPLVLTDWIEMARRIRQPAHMIFGAEDMFARPDAVHEFRRQVGHFGLTMIPDAGAYALYTHWSQVLDALDALQARARPHTHC